MASRDTEHPLTGVLTAVVGEITHLLQTEMRLARAEVREKLAQLSTSGMLIGAGMMLVLPGLVILCLAVVRWLLIAGVPEEWGLTIVAVVVLAVGGGLAITGINALKRSSLVPDRTIDQVRADFSIAKEQVP